MSPCRSRSHCSSWTLTPRPRLWSRGSTKVHRRARLLRHRRRTDPRRDPEPVRPRPRTQPAPQRHRVEQVRRPEHPHRCRRRRPRACGQDALERRPHVGVAWDGRHRNGRIQSGEIRGVELVKLRRIEVGVRSRFARHSERLLPRRKITAATTFESRSARGPRHQVAAVLDDRPAVRVHVDGANATERNRTDGSSTVERILPSTSLAVIDQLP